MLLVDLVGWWYSRGWVWALEQLFVVRTGKIASFFSIGDLLKTLFAPFRQDMIDTRRASLNVKLQALGGNIVSRVLGFLIRVTLIVVGVLAILLNGVFGLLAGLIWPLIPISPLVVIVLISAGVGA